MTYHPGPGPVRLCGACGHGPLDPVLDLGEQPLPQARPVTPAAVRAVTAVHGVRHVTAAGWYPLTLVRCPQCTLVQLGYIVPQEELFPPDYPYATGNTAALRLHFAAQARTIAGLLGPDGGLVIDIGGNDGTMLRSLDRDWTHSSGARFRPRVLLIEPTDQARKAAAAGIEAVQGFFTAALAARIRESHGAARVITASNVFGHVPDPHDFLDGVTALLADDGTLIIDNQDWYNVVNLLQVDTIYHEHLRYYTPASLSLLLARHGLLVTSLTRSPVHGGSFRAVAIREKPDLQGRAAGWAVQLGRMVHEAAKAGLVYAIGAPTRATALIHFAGIAWDLACACEITGSEKIGALIPGTHIPVVDEQALFADQPPHALLLAWDLADSLIPKLRQRGYRGRIIVPLPEPGYADG